MNTAILSRWALVILSGTFSSERLIVFCQEANDWVLFGLAVDDAAIATSTRKTRAGWSVILYPTTETQNANIPTP